MQQAAQPPPANNSYIHQSDKHYLVEVNREFKCVCELCSCGKLPLTQASIDVPVLQLRASSKPAITTTTRISTS